MSQLIRQLMQARDWTQTQTGHALGVSRNTVNRYTMDGPNAINPPESVRRLARLFLLFPEIHPRQLDAAPQETEL